MAPSIYMDQALDKVSISGPILANILQNFTSTHGDCDGILFGHLETTVSSKLEDDDQHSGPQEELTAVITGFCGSLKSLGFYDACGHIDSAKLAGLVRNRGGGGGGRGDPPIGWLSGRRNAPMRPSLREMAVTKHLRLFGSFLSDAPSSPATCKTDSPVIDGAVIMTPQPLRTAGILNSPTKSPSRSTVYSPAGCMASPIELDSPTVDVGSAEKEDFYLSGAGRLMKNKNNQVLTADELCQIAGVPTSSPCIFMLLTESGTDQAIHTHDYRVYQYRYGLHTLEPRTVKVVNIGPAFRVQYDSFSPVSAFPLLKMTTEHNDASESNSSSTGFRIKGRESPLKTPTALSKEQALLDVYSEGYQVERLANLVSLCGMQHVPELEVLYSTMLSKLESLAKQVADSTSALAKQEKANAELRLNITNWE